MGDVFDTRFKVFFVVIDHMGRAIGFGQCTFFVAACGADELQTQRLGPLTSNQTHATGGGVEQNQVPGLQTGLRQSALEHILHGHAFKHHAGCGFKRNIVRQFADVFGRHYSRFAIASGRGAGISRAVACFQMGDAFAHGFNHASTLHAQAMRHRQGVQTGAVVNIDVVQTDGLVRDTHFAGAGVADCDIDKLQHLGTAGLFELNGFAHA